MRRSQHGFTLIEMVVAVTIGFILLAAIGVMAQGAERTQRVARQLGDVVQSGQEVEAILRNFLNEASQQSLVVAPNVAAAFIKTATINGASSDTLVILKARGPARRVSTRPCVAGACIYVPGTATVDSSGPFIIGHPTLGASLVWLDAGVATPLVADGDRPAQQLNCAHDGSVRPVDSLVRVTESRIITGLSDTLLRVGQSCPFTYAGDGSRCVETLAISTLQTRDAMRCGIPAVASETGTQHAYQFLDALVGYPAMATRPMVSGADGLPTVLVQPVQVTRFYVDRSRPATPVLVGQFGLQQNGSAIQWTPAVPIAAPVDSWEVATLYQDSTRFYRGMGLTSDAFVAGGTNPNYVENLQLPGYYRPAWEFAQHFGKLRAIRITFVTRALGGDAGRTGGVRTETYQVTSALPSVVADRSAWPVN